MLIHESEQGACSTFSKDCIARYDTPPTAIPTPGEGEDWKRKQGDIAGRCVEPEVARKHSWLWLFASEKVP